jgi:copper chaperone CopZ
MDTIEHMTHKWFIRWWATICFFFGMGVVFAAHAAPMKPINADMEVKIPGLVCSSCAIGIKRYFKKEINVKDITFDTKKELALIDFVESNGIVQFLRNSKVIELVKKAGYEVKSIKRIEKKTPNRYNKP